MSESAIPDAAALRASLARDGYVLLGRPAFADAARSAPFAAAEALLGVRADMVERQTIRPEPDGKAFAANDREAPLHTDAQLHRGRTPTFQLLACIRPAKTGGESWLLDTWAFVAAIALREPSLHGELFDRMRRIPFVFGEVVGPTFGLRHGALAFCHPPFVPTGDRFAARVSSAVEEHAKEARTTISLQQGDVLIVDNHRMLHGRAAFDDASRELLRLLIWCDPVSRAPAPLWQRAERTHNALCAKLQRAPETVRRAFGISSSRDHDARDRRLSIVLEMLRGTPPGLLARKWRVAEALLYRWRDAFIAGGLPALEEHALQTDDRALADWLAKIA